MYGTRIGPGLGVHNRSLKGLNFATLGNAIRALFANNEQGAWYEPDAALKLRKNLFNYTESADNSTWTKQNTTVTANSVAGHDGVVSADTVTMTTAAAAYHSLAQTVSVVNGLEYTSSVRAKANGCRWLCLQTGGTDWTTQGQNSGVVFDLQTGTVSSAYNGQSTGNASITSEGNGYYRCSVKWTAKTTTSGGVLSHILRLTNDLSPQTGDGTSGVYVRDFQFEQASAVTAYQPILADGAVEYSALAGRRNLITFSQQIVTGWIAQAVTSSNNVTTAPDGTLSADLITENTAAGFHYMDAPQQAGLADNTVISGSIYVKPNGRDVIQLTLYHKGGGGADLRFRFSTKSVLQHNSYLGSTYTVTELPNGWFRFSIDGMSVGSGGTVPRLRVFLFDNTPASSYTGDGTSGIYVWGAQVEVGSKATAYQRGDDPQLTGVSMFQDTNGATPVTAAGQPVGLWLDRSGRFNHLVQATTAAKPVLQQAGGLYYLDFDGVDDWMTSATGGGMVSQEAFAAVMPIGGAGVSRDVLSDGGAFRVGASSGNVYFCFVNTVASAAAATLSVPAVVGGRFDGSNATARSGGVDGTPVAASLLAQAAGFGVGAADGGGSAFFNGRIYGLVWRTGTYTTAQRSSVEKYLAAKNGATIA